MTERGPALAGARPGRCRALVRAVATAALVLPLAACAAPPQPTADDAALRMQATSLDQVPASVFAAEVERRVLDEANAFRRRQGLAVLVREPRLDLAARGFARSLTGLRRFDHDADGRDPADRVEATGYRWCSVAENLAWQFDSRGFQAAELSGRLVDGWIASPGHRRNLLDDRVSQTGVGVVQARDGRWFAVQLFARPEATGPRGGCRPTGGRAGG